MIAAGAAPATAAETARSRYSDCVEWEEQGDGALLCSQGESRGDVHAFTLKSEGVGSADGQTCPFTVHADYANGAVRVERVDAGCVD